MAKNTLGTDLEDCCLDPATGFFRDGSCDTCDEDLGMHTVCAEMTEEFSLLLVGLVTKLFNFVY